MTFYAVSTIQGKESEVADSLAKAKSPHIHAALAPDRLKSYVIVEADGLQPVEKSVSDTYGANKVLPGMTSFQEVQGFLSPTSRVEGISEGEVVELTGGPYQGQAARVEHINHEKEQVTVELHEEMIPLTVEISADQIRTV